MASLPSRGLCYREHMSEHGPAEAVSDVLLREGQVVKFRRRNRTEYMRLLMDCPERPKNTGTYVTLYGYRTRADGSPTHVRPVTRVLFAAEVEIVAGLRGRGE